jgi:hypothetical protein
MGGASKITSKNLGGFLNTDNHIIRVPFYLKYLFFLNLFLSCFKGREGKTLRLHFLIVFFSFFTIRNKNSTVDLII